MEHHFFRMLIISGSQEGNYHTIAVIVSIVDIYYTIYNNICVIISVAAASVSFVCENLASVFNFKSTLIFLKIRNKILKVYKLQALTKMASGGRPWINFELIVRNISSC